jgi:hypothetical protein
METMKSRIFECSVMHERFSPKRHRFVYRMFMFALDLDELPRVHETFHLFSANARNVCSVFENDYLPTSASPYNPSTLSAPATDGSDTATTGTLKARVLKFLRMNGIKATLGRVELITMPRILGYHFNPVSFYFCYDSGGEPLAAIAEVTNTFREMKPFLLRPEVWSKGAFRLRVPKHFYVSPYSDVDVAFDFVLRPANEKLAIQIDDYSGVERTLATSLAGKAVPFTDRSLGWFLIKYPLLTLQVMALIHWHALILYLKKVPWFRKAARRGDQRDLYRPHVSLTTPNPIER